MSEKIVSSFAHEQYGLDVFDHLPHAAGAYAGAEATTYTLIIINHIFV